MLGRNSYLDLIKGEPRNDYDRQPWYKIRQSFLEHEYTSFSHGQRPCRGSSTLVEQTTTDVS